MLTMVQSGYVIGVLYFIQVFAVKLSILAFYLRLFPGKIMRRLIWATIGVIVSFIIIYGLITVFQCYPISHYWRGWAGETEGHCLNMNAMAWANAASNILLDMWMLGLPLPPLKKMQLHWKKRVRATLMFSVGLLCAWPSH